MQNENIFQIQSMINQITFKNFKLFKKKQSLDLLPITILIGKNNSGKSAVLKLPTMIEGALKSNEPHPIQLVNDRVVIGNEYLDLVYGKFGRALEFELFQKNTRSGKKDALTAHIIIDNINNKPILDYWKLNEDIELQRVEKKTYINEIDETEYLCDFLGLILGQYFYKGTPDSSGTVFEQTFRLNTDFIGGIREKACKYYDYKPKNNNKSNIDGSNLYNFLIEDFLTTDKKYYSQINNWITEKFEGWELYIDVDTEPFHIELRKDNLHINLSETGMGIGQSLPLVIRAFKPCNEKTLIIIEEPESHLHPYAHAELAQLFVDSLKSNSNKKYLFETHSLNFILRMRRLVAAGILNKDELAIYYIDFDEENNTSELRKIQIDDDGEVEWWPQGVFNESLDEVIELRKAQDTK